LDLLLEFHISVLTFGLLSYVSLKEVFAWLVCKNDGQSSESSRILDTLLPPSPKNLIYINMAAITSNIAQFTQFYLQSVLRIYIL